MQRVNFTVGENRYVRLLIKAMNNQPFTIWQATYELSIDGVIEKTGDCVIDDHLIMALISPVSIGNYKLKLSYQIGDEILIELIELAVR